MGTKTILFGGTPEATSREQGVSEVAVETYCSVCKRSLPSTNVFCPFDGERLVAQPVAQTTLDPLLGVVIDDRYEVLAVIGEGGMGRVYRVRHRRLGRSFALKALRADLARETVLSERFMQEARAAAVVTHPNVVQINDFGTLPTGQPYFVMELLEGRTLTRILREEGPMAPARCVGIVRQIAEALAAAHAMGVIHRDLKPDNIIVVRPSGSHSTVKVLDFGLAKVAGSSRLTRPGVVFGTPYYMSPEQAGGEEFDHRVNVYALGIVLFELITGRVPFDADTYMGVLSKHLYVAPPKLREFKVPLEGLAGFEEIIEGCLAKKPEDRWPNMTELARRLNALSSTVAYQSSPPIGDLAQRAVPEQVAPNYRRTVARYLAAAFFALTLMAIGSLAWLRARGHSSSSKVSHIAAATELARSAIQPAPKPWVPSPNPSQARETTPAGLPSTAAIQVPMAHLDDPAHAPPASNRRHPPPTKKNRLESAGAPKTQQKSAFESGDIADPWAK